MSFKAAKERSKQISDATGGKHDKIYVSNTHILPHELPCHPLYFTQFARCLFGEAMSNAFYICDFFDCDFSKLKPPVYVDFAYCVFRDCNFEGVDADRAVFHNCEIDCCNFEGADVSRAVFHNCEIDYCSFVEATLNWQAHDLIANILKMEAGNNLEKRKIASFIKGNQDLCWDDFIEICENPEDINWAFEELSKYVKEDSKLPAVAEVFSDFLYAKRTKLTKQLNEALNADA